jgi:hypothetical protein
MQTPVYAQTQRQTLDADTGVCQPRYTLDFDLGACPNTDRHWIQTQPPCPNTYSDADTDTGACPNTDTDTRRMSKHRYRHWMQTQAHAQTQIQTQAHVQTQIPTPDTDTGYRHRRMPTTQIHIDTIQTPIQTQAHVQTQIPTPDTDTGHRHMFKHRYRHRIQTQRTPTTQIHIDTIQTPIQTPIQTQAHAQTDGHRLMPKHRSRHWVQKQAHAQTQIHAQIQTRACLNTGRHWIQIQRSRHWIQTQAHAANTDTDTAHRHKMPKHRYRHGSRHRRMPKHLSRHWIQTRAHAQTQIQTLDTDTGACPKIQTLETDLDTDTGRPSSRTLFPVRSSCGEKEEGSEALAGCSHHASHGGRVPRWCTKELESRGCNFSEPST